MITLTISDNAVNALVFMSLIIAIVFVIFWMTKD